MSTYASLLKGIYQSKAALFIQLHPHCSYADLRAHLEESLDRNKDLSAQMAFHTRKRQPGETLMVYANSLQLLAHAAYGGTPGGSTEMIETMVLRAFHENLQGDLGRRVRERYSETLQAAIMYARNLELSGVTESEAEKVAAVAPRTPASGNPNKNKECWSCGKLGHVSADCWGKKKNNNNNNNNHNNSDNNNSNRGRGRGRGRGGYRNNGSRPSNSGNGNEKKEQKDRTNQVKETEDEEQ